MAYNSQNIFLRDNINGRPGEMRDLELLRYLGRTSHQKNIWEELNCLFAEDPAAGENK